MICYRVTAGGSERIATMGNHRALTASSFLLFTLCAAQLGVCGFVSRPGAPTSGVVNGIVEDVDCEECVFQFRDDGGSVYRVAYEEQTVFSGPREGSATPLLRKGARVSIKYAREVNELGARDRGHCPIRYLATFIRIDGPVALASSPVP